ncbi:YqeB family protein [Pseudactinotalea sp. Z1748]|uniref:YqeB family protein n=1 Tax=Pseudactinotalea sp. Z1748 TaxID=3413027 RepID=UPI003C7D89FB
MSSEDSSVPDGATRVGGLGPADRWLTVLLFGALGLSVGLLVPLLANWAAEVPWMPFQGPLQLIGSFDHDWLTWGRPAIGAVLGLLVALFVLRVSPVLTLTDERIEIRAGDEVTVIEREKVDGVRRKGSNIVILSATGRELFHGEVEGSKDALREAFLRHDYPWESA